MKKKTKKERQEPFDEKDASTFLFLNLNIISPQLFYSTSLRKFFTLPPPPPSSCQHFVIQRVGSFVNGTFQTVERMRDQRDGHSCTTGIYR